MKPHSPTIVTYEYGTLSPDGPTAVAGAATIPVKAFDNLWNFILSNRSDRDSDNVMSVSSRRGNRLIRTKNFVGTLQTADGTVIEILPKIYNSSERDDADFRRMCRKVFLDMLRHATDTDSRSFQEASLRTSDDFPILETYIAIYAGHVERLLVEGLRRDYKNVADDTRFLKGRLDITRQITRHPVDKSRFAIHYDKYVDDTAQNRIIVSTLLKLHADSNSASNKSRLANLLNRMPDIPPSTAVVADLRRASAGNRLFASYDSLMLWSSQFLLGRGFTNFAGDHVNQALLFRSDKLFESFIAHLFRKYARTCCAALTVRAQDSRYHLVDDHAGKSRFALRPDIVITDPQHHCLIVDTKWKTVDSSSAASNYGIAMSDMYQLYAYGQKYRRGMTERIGRDIMPDLMLLYPMSERFSSPLPGFTYDANPYAAELKLTARPFDLSSPRTYEAQIHDILAGYFGR